MNVRRRRDRPGYSLIEMVLVMGGMTIVLVLCGGLLHTLLRLDRAGRESMNDTTTVARLGRQFRQDVRASTSAEAAPAGSLELTRGEGPAITYRVDGGLLRREERDGKTVLRREGYAAARLGPVAFEVDGKVVRLRLSRRSGNPHAVARPAVDVAARLGKDQSLGEPAESKK